MSTATNNTESRLPTQQQTTNQNQQNNQPENITGSQSSVMCGDFAKLSDFVLKNIQQPDSQKTIENNPYVITSFNWKRSAEEPFISYPIINGVSAFYGDDKTNHSIDFTISAIKKDSDALNQALNTEAKNLGLSTNSLNTLPLQSFSNQDVTQVFAFNKGENLYTIALTVDSGDHQAPPQGTVKITCGKALDNYNKVYSALNLKADSSVKDSYNNDYVAIGDVSSDSTVYAILGSPNQIKIADYYYFDGEALRLVSKDSYPTQCAPLESQKVGLGMRCADANYSQRTVTYQSSTNNNTAQAITITSPNGGERLVKGKTFRITWNTSASFNSNYPQVTITLITAKGQQAVSPSQQIIANNTGNFDWTIPTAQLSGYIQDYSGGPYNLRPLNDQTEFQFLIEGYPHITGRAEGPFDYSNGSFYLVSQ